MSHISECFLKYFNTKIAEVNEVNKVKDLSAQALGDTMLKRFKPNDQHLETKSLLSKLLKVNNAGTLKDYNISDRLGTLAPLVGATYAANRYFDKNKKRAVEE